MYKRIVIGKHHIPDIELDQHWLRCWPISKIQWYSSEGDFTLDALEKWLPSGGFLSLASIIHGAYYVVTWWQIMVSGLQVSFRDLAELCIIKLSYARILWILSAVSNYELHRPYLINQQSLYNWSLLSIANAICCILSYTHISYVCTLRRRCYQDAYIWQTWQRTTCLFKPNTAGLAMRLPYG